MKSICRLGFAATFAACAIHGSCAEGRGPSTSDERARFVALVRSLESDPLGVNADIVRQQLRDWVVQVPDIRFKVCPTLLAGGLGNYRYSRELILQVTLSGAVLTIDDPGEARDDVAVYTAGVNGALRAYEVLVKGTATAHSPVLDDLIHKRDRGELFDHVAELAREECPKSNALLIAPIGAATGLILAVLVTRWFGGRGGSKRVLGNRGTRNPTTFRTIVLVCATYYVVVGIALHVLEPGFDPRYRFMSDYAWGTYGWLMTTTFFVLGLAVLTVAIGLRDVHQFSRSARIGFGLLVVGGVFVCLAGIFRGFPLHDVASAVAIPSLLLAAIILSWSFRIPAGWQPIYPATVLICLGMSGAFLSMVVDIGMPGLQQRVFLFLLVVWLSIVADRLPGEMLALANTRPQPYV